MLYFKQFTAKKDGEDESSMLTVMIVEDEMLVRMGLSVSIDWEKRNMRLVAEVGNGNDGYYAFLRHRPNIVITDIRMPGIDGLTLI